jgi:hypothetical protein
MLGSGETSQLTIATDLPSAALPLLKEEDAKELSLLVRVATTQTANICRVLALGQPVEVLVVRN